jgi:hypothetical protein
MEFVRDLQTFVPDLLEFDPHTIFVGRGFSRDIKSLQRIGL